MGQSAKLKSVAGHFSAFVVAQKLTYIEKFGLMLNQSFYRLIPYPICYESLKLGAIQHEQTPIFVIFAVILIVREPRGRKLVHLHRVICPGWPLSAPRRPVL